MHTGMKINEIYTKYKIIPSLQLHMKRVASVAKVIADNLTVAVDTDNIVKAMLLHDMGNILKFNMTIYPDLFMPEGVDYWQRVKDEYTRRYGLDEHMATEEIAKELNVADRVFELLSAVGFSKSKANLETSDLSKKICCYSDQRVAIYGITDLITRLSEGRDRHKMNKGDKEKDKFDEGVNNLIAIESQIFAQSKITPQYIDNEKVALVIESGYLENIAF